MSDSGPGGTRMVQVQIALVVLLVDFRQDTSLICDHLILAEVRFGIFPVVARDAVTIQYRLHFQAEREWADTSFRCFQRRACLAEAIVRLGMGMLF